jgi:hypothetical protein
MQSVLFFMILSAAMAMSRGMKVILCSPVDSKGEIAPVLN